MFKNPLKYQQGGQLNEQQQQMLAAFIDWLPKRVKEFQGMKPEAIVQALDGMSKTPEGQKQVQQLMEQFQQESQSGQSFKRGGKIQDFICKHARGGQVAGCGCEKSVKKAQDGTSMPQYQVTRDTTYMNPANQRIMEQIIVGPDGQAYRRTTVNGTNPIAVGGYWNENQFYPEGDSSIPNNRFDSLFRRAIPKIQKTQSNQNVVKNQNPAGPIPEPDASYFGTISSDPTTNPIRRWIDNKINNNSTLHHIRQGVQNFAQSAPGGVLRFFMPESDSESGMLGAAYMSPIAKEINLGKYIGYRTPTQAVYTPKQEDALQKALRDRKNWEYPGDLDIDKMMPLIKSQQYNWDNVKLLRLEDIANVPKLIMNLGLKATPGIVGSAALGSYVATKNNKNKKSENK